MSILDEIVAQTRADLRIRRRQVSLRELEQLPGFEAPRRSLEDSLRSEGLAVIAEVKRASPSQGMIRDDIVPADVAQAYEAAGASAISVLTEPHFFQGSLDSLAAARSVTSVPLLRKDFVVDPYQVFEARSFGADAVLLIASVLSRDQLYELLAAAAELQLDCLVETYWERDLDLMDFGQIRIFGVNNRNLEDFTVDLGRSREMFRHVPDGVVRVAESGMSRPEHLAEVAEAGADAVLIGESLMRAPDPGAALGQLLEQFRLAGKADA